ncbi:hypothetical protein X777_09655 [Ooceraea biroi]|uniref:Uncharacterized protein n=1 Tax=Ooceraea biroi TaxID=2015173 RepID=A0A026W6Y4_OOCBI|nr:hypothetical protein X777_09655 [Ooceraea biroi]
MVTVETERADRGSLDGASASSAGQRRGHHRPAGREPPKDEGVEGDGEKPSTMMGGRVARPGAGPRPLVAPIAAFVACVLLCGTLGEWNVSSSRLRAHATDASVYVGVFESVLTAHARARRARVLVDGPRGGGGGEGRGGEGASGPRPLGPTSRPRSAETEHAPPHCSLFSSLRRHVGRRGSAERTTMESVRLGVHLARESKSVASMADAMDVHRAQARVAIARS